MTREHSGASLLVEHRADGVAVVRFDQKDEPLNTLQEDFAVELSEVLTRLEPVTDLKAVVFTSGKPDRFVAGADVRLLRAVEHAERASAWSRAGQRVLAGLAAYRVPVVAAIHGPCLGGGLELALACSARVVSTDSKTKLGLPEVQLGLPPALGGTQRLPRLVGVEPALELLLTGKQIDGPRALRIGLVDELVPSAILLEVAVRLALERASRPPARESRLRRFFRPSGLKEFALAENALGRNLLFERAHAQLLEKTHGNYPAPERILRVVKLGLAEGLERGLEAEANAFGELIVSDVARALMHVFFAKQELEKDRGLDAPASEARTVRRVGTIGAGPIGAGIAYVTAARAGVEVRLGDRDGAALGNGLKYVRDILDERVKANRSSPGERDLTMARITATTSFEGFAAVDLLIEAVFEDLDTKQQVLAEFEQHAGKFAIFGSNTSSLPIARIAARARRPEQVIGMHYFSPVAQMPLLEIVITEATAPRVVATCVEFGKRQGKTVIVVRDGPGFYTSRILGAYLNEASFLIAEGVPIEQIDHALLAWGFPVGPITRLDEIGIDMAAKVGHVLHEALGPRMAPAPVIDALLKDGRLGKRNQLGFYSYGGKRNDARIVDASVYSLLALGSKRELSGEEITQRCTLQMINEAAHCFGEGILRGARDGDIGAILGVGFPAFRGGPFHYLDMVGAADIVRRLERYASFLGPRFTPAPLLAQMAKLGGSFYGAGAVAPAHPRG